jgi:hypothetical protein
MARFQILAFDGGGIRGAFGVGFLQELEAQANRKLRDCFDLIAGTSTGAITALGMGVGFGGDDLVSLYQRSGPKIFAPQPEYVPDSIWVRHIYPYVKKVLALRTKNNIDQFFRSKYSSAVLRDCLHQHFGACQMKDIEGPRIIVPSINLTDGEPHIFGTPHLPMHLDDADLKILDVLMATTAAPTYFAHYEMPDGSAHADGGLWANSPGLLGLAEALRLRQLCVGDHCAPPFSTREIYMLTIGTGTAKFSLKPPGEDAGAIYWAPQIADVMLSSQVQGLEVPLRFLLADRVKQINFQLPDETWKLDAVEHLDEMIEMGRAAARKHGDEIIEKFLSHVPVPFDHVDDEAHDSVDDPSLESAL